MLEAETALATKEDREKWFETCEIVCARLDYCALFHEVATLGAQLTALVNLRQVSVC